MSCPQHPQSSSCLQELPARWGAGRAEQQLPGSRWERALPVQAAQMLSSEGSVPWGLAQEPWPHSGG